MTLPNFLIAGGQRCSSTWLWTLCNQHPDIFMAQAWKPEPKFFSSAAYFRGLDYYSQTFFAGARGEPAIGEKSVTYLDHPGAPAWIYNDLPDVRLVFLLRDPVERAFSHYRYSRHNCLETLSFRDALINEPWRARRTPAPLVTARPWAYVDRSCYAKHLTRFFDLFPRQNIRVIFSEEMHANPSAVSAQLFEFLGVPPLSVAVALPDSVNRVPSSNIEPEVREYLVAALSGQMDSLEALVGREVPTSWRS
jgi:hypothetical protein